MKTFLKISTAVILSLLFMAMAAAYFATYGVRSKASNSDFYKKQLIKNDIYERTYSEVLPTIIKSKDNDSEAENLYGGLQNNFKLTDADVEALGRQLINKEEFLIPNVERLLDNGFDYVNNKTDDLDLSVDLTNVKSKAPGILTDFALQLFARLPECPANKQLVVNDVLLFRQGVIPSCFNDVSVDAQTRTGVKTATGIDLPPKVTRENFQPLVRPSIETQVNASVAKMPNKLDIVDEIADSNNQSREDVLGNFDSARSAFGFSTGWGLILLCLFMLLALAGIYFLLRNSPIEPFTWIGATIASVGFITLIGALAAKSKITTAINEKSFSENRPEIAGIVKDLFISMTKEVANGFVLQSLFFLIGGLIIIGISIYIIMKRRTAAVRDLS